jgi:hypothetical protein
MLFNNYKQALSIIDVEGSAVEETTHALGINISDLEAWHHCQEHGIFRTIFFELFLKHNHYPPFHLLTT